MCESCNVLWINGVKCHEAGCPDAWKDDPHECQWCGQPFQPESEGQKYCSVECQDDDIADGNMDKCPDITEGCEKTCGRCDGFKD